MDNTETRSHVIQMEGHIDIIAEKKHMRNQVVTSNKMVENLSVLPQERCIYRVPYREVNVKAYTPGVISIGPLHRGKECLQVIEKEKLRYVKNFLKCGRMRLEDCVLVIQQWEERARNFYDDKINLKSDEFVQMLLVDGIFIVELFLRYTCPPLINEFKDCIFYRPHLLRFVMLDMILLENQLPFFLLEGLFNMAIVSRKDGNVTPTFLELTHTFFKSFVSRNAVRNRI